MTVDNSKAEHVYGGRSIWGNADDNTVTISGGKIDNSVYGGFSGFRAGQENLPKDAGGKDLPEGPDKDGEEEYYGELIDRRRRKQRGLHHRRHDSGANVYGGRANSWGAAVENHVSIENGTVTNDVFGGYSYYGAVEGNEVVIRADGTAGTVYGGFSESGSASGNKVEVYGTAEKEAVKNDVGGGAVGGYDASAEGPGGSNWPAISISSDSGNGLTV